MTESTFSEFERKLFLQKMKLKKIGIFAATVLAQMTAAADELSSTRYGLFDGLDHRSIYGQGYFPEPFLVDDSDLEPTEARFDWLHTQAGAQHSDAGKAEMEK